MNIVFLDVDGVLNERATKERTPSGYVGIDDSKVAMLAKICRKLSANLVLTSDWRDCLYKNDIDGKYLVDKLHKQGLYLIGIVPSVTSFRRGMEIKKYLDTYKNIIDKYIILDDNEFDFHQVEEVATHAIITDVEELSLFNKYEGEYGIFKAKALMYLEDNFSDEVRDILEFIKENNPYLKEDEDDI